MSSAEKYWKEQIVIIGLIFLFYTVTKDLIEEGKIPVISFFFNSKAISALIYAGIVLIFVIVFHGVALFLSYKLKK